MPRRVQVQDPVGGLDEYRIGVPVGEILIEVGLVGHPVAGVAQHQVDRVVADDQHLTDSSVDDLTELMQLGVERVRIRSALRRAERGQYLDRVHSSSGCPSSSAASSSRQ